MDACTGTGVRVEDQSADNRHRDPVGKLFFEAEANSTSKCPGVFVLRGRGSRFIFGVYNCTEFAGCININLFVYYHFLTATTNQPSNHFHDFVNSSFSFRKGILT